MNYRQSLKKNQPNKQTQIAFNGGELSGKWDLNRICYVDWMGIITTEKKNPYHVGPPPHGAKHLYRGKSLRRFQYYVDEENASFN